jgi:protein tyrosine/serine phosphatase
LTTEGRQALLDYGVRTIIDLRSPREVAEEPSVLKDNAHNLTCLNLPLEKYDPHVA